MYKQLITTTLTIFSITLPLEASAATFKQIFAFGDSLTDSNNIGPISNGPLWVDYLAEDLGLDPLPSISQVSSGTQPPTNGINFAFAGATTGTENTVALTFPDDPALANLPGLQQEIGIFTSSFTQIANPDALYIIWAGGDDYLPTEGTFIPRQETDTPTTNIFNAVDSLVQEGAENILLVNLPDLAQLPLTLPLDDRERTSLTDLTLEHNQKLTTFSQNLPKNVKLTNFDVYSLFANVIDKPADFGFNNITEACSKTGIFPQCDGYLFFDEIHPTTVAHRIIANAALKSLQPIPESSFNLGFLAIGAVGTMTLLRGKN